MITWNFNGSLILSSDFRMVSSGFWNTCSIKKPQKSSRAVLLLGTMIAFYPDFWHEASLMYQSQWLHPFSIESRLLWWGLCFFRWDLERHKCWTKFCMRKKFADWFSPLNSNSTMVSSLLTWGWGSRKSEIWCGWQNALHRTRKAGSMMELYSFSRIYHPVYFHCVIPHSSCVP